MRKFKNVHDCDKDLKDFLHTAHLNKWMLFLQLTPH